MVPVGRAVCALGLIFVLVAPLHAAVIGGPYTHAGHDYLLLDASSWTAAEAEAVALGGNLVSIDDQAEQDFVWETFHDLGGTERGLWIGLTDAAVEGTFVWTSGAPLGYTNWDGGEPNNSTFFGVEDFTIIVPVGVPDMSLAPGNWNDWPDLDNIMGIPAHGVVEIPATAPSIVPVAAKKLVVLDRLTAAGKAKTLFLAKDAAVTKGAFTDVTRLYATLDVAYDGVRGSFRMPPGPAWLANTATLARYLDATAPAGGPVKLGLVKPGTRSKVLAPSLGDPALDIAAAPSGTVYVAETIVNGGEKTQLCTQFSGCSHRTIAGGTGYRLTCTNGVGDALCVAAQPTTTTTSSSTTSTMP